MRFSATRIILPAILTLFASVQYIYPAFWDEAGERMSLALEAMEKLTPSLMDHPVTFAIRTGDPQTGSFFPADEEELAGISAWQIQILDGNGKKVSFIQGKNGPDRIMFPWSGLSNDGDPLPDGFYSAKLVWKDPDNKVRSTPRTSFSLFTSLEIRNLSDKKLKFEYTGEGLVIRIYESRIFKPGEAAIRPEALPALREIALFLRAHPRNKVAVRGFTDSTGSFQRNLQLSRERASGVHQYLINAGIDQSRMTYEGLGPNKPVASNTTEEGRTRNRRVEVVVLRTTI